MRWLIFLFLTVFGCTETGIVKHTVEEKYIYPSYYDVYVESMKCNVYKFNTIHHMVPNAIISANKLNNTINITINTHNNQQINIDKHKIQF